LFPLQETFGTGPESPKASLPCGIEVALSRSTRLITDNLATDGHKFNAKLAMLVYSLPRTTKDIIPVGTTKIEGVTTIQ